MPALIYFANTIDKSYVQKQTDLLYNSPMNTPTSSVNVLQRGERREKTPLGFVVISKTQKLESTETFEPFPRRMRQVITCADADSLINYSLRFQTELTAGFFHGNVLLIIYDYGTLENPCWGDHYSLMTDVDEETFAVVKEKLPAIRFYNGYPCEHGDLFTND